MNDLVSIEIFGEWLTFSAAHFTLFSPTEREPLHGHNYDVSASVATKVQSDGIAFNYEIYRDKIVALCQEINIRLLLPGQSPFLRIEEKGKFYHAHFNGEEMPFLKSDTVILPVKNISLEELARWFLTRLLEDKKSIKTYAISELVINVSSGHGRSAARHWTA
jgi:6-pyruvoyltetrahydropterin/6-carboxytetrahydropterin synthase